MAIYTHWRDYYKREFLDEYNRFFNKNNKRKKIEYYNNFYNLFYKSYTLLKYYLNNNGLYQFSELDVIREAFYIEIIKDGDAWIDILNAANFIKNNTSFANNIDFIDSVTTKNLHVFKQLKKTIEGLV